MCVCVCVCVCVFRVYLQIWNICVKMYIDIIKLL